MASACTIEDMYKNFQILADAKEKAGEVTVYELVVWVWTGRRINYRPVTAVSLPPISLYLGVIY